MHTSRFGYFAAWSLKIVLMSGCGSTNTFVPPPPPEVTVAYPVTRNVADSIEFVGTTRATATVELRARVNGYLEKILFEDGADVVANQELFLIEQSPYLAALDSAKAALQKAQAELQLAQSQYKRMAPLVAQRAITEEELDIQAAQVETAKADVASAAAALKSAELNLQYTTIRAPIAGHIGRHLVDIGNLVQAEQTLLAEIQSIDPIYAYFDVSERDLLRFMEMIRGQQVPDPDKNPPTLHLGLANESNFPHEGKLDYRELGIHESTGTALRRGIFPNPNRELLPGMFVRIRAQVGDPKPKLLVDDRAVGADQRGSYLLVVNAENVVEYRPVRLGIESDGLRVVEDGITPKDRVVINGLQRARPGTKVQPQIAEMAAGLVESTQRPGDGTDDAASQPVEGQAGVPETEAKASPGNETSPEPTK
jgi:RND family efflux transporter MFP subunit